MERIEKLFFKIKTSEEYNYENLNSKQIWDQIFKDVENLIKLKGTESIVCPSCGSMGKIYKKKVGCRKRIAYTIWDEITGLDFQTSGKCGDKANDEIHLCPECKNKNGFLICACGEEIEENHMTQEEVNNREHGEIGNN